MVPGKNISDYVTILFAVIPAEVRLVWQPSLEAAIFSIGSKVVRPHNFYAAAHSDNHGKNNDNYLLIIWGFTQEQKNKEGFVVC